MKPGRVPSLARTTRLPLTESTPIVILVDAAIDDYFLLGQFANAVTNSAREG